MDYDVRIISTEKGPSQKRDAGCKTNPKTLQASGSKEYLPDCLLLSWDYYLNQTKAQAFRNPYATVRVEGFQRESQYQKVENVPVLFPHEKQVKNMIRISGDEPGLYPDILAPFEGGVQMILEQWRALWVDCEIPKMPKAAIMT